MASLRGSESVADRVRRFAALLVFVALTGLGLFSNVADVARVCTVSTTHDDAVVTLCRPLAMTDPPMVFGTLTAALLLGPDASTLGQTALDLRRPPRGTKKGRR